MAKLMKIFEAFLQAIFGKLPEEQKETPMTKRTITRIPAYGEKGEHVKILQEALNEAGASPKLTVDGDFGAKTKFAVVTHQNKIGSGGSGIIGNKTLASLNITVDEAEATYPKDFNIPWYVEAKKYSGKKETDSAWAAKLGAMWGKVGLPQYKGKLAGSTYAWCALFVAANLMWAGYDINKGNASAKSWDNWGQSVAYKVNGIPRAAVVRINSKGDCASWTGNHVTFANGSCSQADVLKSGATFSGYGGNQGDQAKVSTYAVKNICAVRWPKEEPLPGTQVSENCSNGKTADVESTK